MQTSTSARDLNHERTLASLDEWRQAFLASEAQRRVATPSVLTDDWYAARPCQPGHRAPGCDRWHRADGRHLDTSRPGWANDWLV